MEKDLSKKLVESWKKESAEKWMKYPHLPCGCVLLCLLAHSPERQKDRQQRHGHDSGLRLSHLPVTSMTNAPEENSALEKKAASSKNQDTGDTDPTNLPQANHKKKERFVKKRTGTGDSAKKVFSKTSDMAANGWESLLDAQGRYLPVGHQGQRAGEGEERDPHLSLSFPPNPTSPFETSLSFLHLLFQRGSFFSQHQSSPPPDSLSTCYSL